MVSAVNRRQSLSLVLGALTVATLATTNGAHAHGFMAGDLFIDHPYAVPAPAGASAAVYLRTIRNAGRHDDRLLAASTPVASLVEIHRSTVHDGVMRMGAIGAIDLPAGASLKLRHGGDVHLMLLGLKTMLKEGDRFSLVLRFERGGEREVTVWVQQPRGAVHTQ